MLDAVIADMKIPDAEVEQLIPSGQSRVRNQIQWARFYLTKAGYMDPPKSGQWRLTQEGVEAKLTEDQVYELFQRIHQQVGGAKKSKPKKAEENLDNAIVEDEEHTESLLETLKSLSPKGFERICKRLLTEIGIHDIQITGGAGDRVSRSASKHTISAPLFPSCGVGPLRRSSGYAVRAPPCRKKE